MSDKELEHAVAEELEWAPHVDASHILVSVRNGVVRLPGYVRSLAERKAAIRAVWHVRGVRGLEDELEVRPPEAHQHSDDEIARRAMHILLWDSQIPGSRIGVQVENGFVTLTGAVDWHYQRAEAERQLQRLAGVIAVDNRITLQPPSAIAAEIHERVVRALRRHSELNASRIVVQVHDDRVTLSGNVPSLKQRRVAENAAWSAPGVTDVLDLLRVGS